MAEEEEERHKRSLTPQKHLQCSLWPFTGLGLRASSAEEPGTETKCEAPKFFFADQCMPKKSV
jgi:hypothetical protein